MEIRQEISEISEKLVNLEFSQKQEETTTTLDKQDEKENHCCYLEFLPPDANGPIHRIFSCFTDIRTKLKLESVSPAFRDFAQKFSWDNIHTIEIATDCIVEQQFLEDWDQEKNDKSDETAPKTAACDAPKSDVVLFNRVQRTNEGCVLNGILCRSVNKMISGLKSLLERYIRIAQPYRSTSADASPPLNWWSKPLTCSIVDLNLRNDLKCNPTKLKSISLKGEGYTDDSDRIEVAQKVFDCLKESGFNFESLRVKKLFARAAYGLPDFLIHFRHSLESFRAEWMFFENPEDRQRFYEAVGQCGALDDLNLDWDLGASLEPTTQELLTCALMGKRLRTLSLHLFSNLQTEAFAAALSSLCVPLDELFLHQCRSLEFPVLFMEQSCQSILRGLKKLTLNTIVGDEVFAYDIYKLLPQLPEICPNLQTLVMDLGFLDFDEEGHYRKEMYGLTMLVRNYLNGNKAALTPKCLLLDWTCDACKADPKLWIEMIQKEVYFDEFGLILSQDDWNGYDESVFGDKLGMKVTRGSAAVVFVTSWCSW